MKLKQMLAGILAGAMVVTGLPSLGWDGIGSLQARAEETAAQSPEAIYRYQSIQGMKAYAEWDTKYDAPIEYLLNDNASITFSRYNTGNIPRSTYMKDNNNIFIQMSAATDVSKLSYYPNDEERSGGNGENVSNGTFTRVNVYVSTADPSPISGNPKAEDAAWQLKLENVKLNSDTDKTAEDSKIPRHDFELDEPVEGVTAVRVEVLDSAGEYDGSLTAQDPDKRDMFISGRELEVYSDDATKVANNAMTFSADFDTQEGKGIGNLNDGELGTMMLSVQGGESSENGPVKQNEHHYFANNNMYFTLPESTLIGKLTYVAGALNGSITKARIYVSNVELGEGEEPKDIDASAWLKVYDNADAEDGWDPYTRGGSIARNSTEVVFDSLHMARHVRVEVLETKYSENAADQNQVTNKWISGRRIYIYKAEPLNQVEADTNVALSKAAGGKATVVAYTGEAQSTKIEKLNDGVDNTEDDGNYWLPKYDIRPGEAGSGKENYVILDLGTTETKISEIAIRWHNRAYATKYKVETSDTCGVAGDVTDSENKTVDGSKDVWTTVVDYTRQGNSTPTYPKEEFNGDDLKQKTLKRYVRLSMTESNDGSYDNGGKPNLWSAVREFQITGTGLQFEEVENVALGTQSGGKTEVCAYTGDTTTTAAGAVGIQYLNDGEQIEHASNNGNRWQATRPIKTGGTYNAKGSREGFENCVNYVILDLGEGTETELKSIRIRWENMLFATEYRIQTSDVCDVASDPNVKNEDAVVTMVSGEPVVSGDPYADKWETVARYFEEDAETTPTGVNNPLHEFGEGKANELEKTYLRRYVRILVTKMNLWSGADSVAIKEVEINGIRRKAETSQVDLDWMFDNTKHEGGEVVAVSTTDPTPRYGTIFRNPSTRDGAGYHVADVTWQVASGDPVKWETVPTSYFDFGKEYKGTVEIESTVAPFSDIVDVTVNGEQASKNDKISVDVQDGKLVVSRIYGPLTDYTAKYEALKAWLKSEDGQEIAARHEAGQGEASNAAWKQFENAYKHVTVCLAREITENNPDSGIMLTAPSGFTPNDFDNGKNDLIRAYNSIKSGKEELEMDDDGVVITVALPEEEEQDLANAKLTRGGSVTTDPVSLKPVPGDKEYSIGVENELQGTIKFPNGEGGNDVFNVTETNQFLMSFGLKVPKRLAENRKESIIGRFNKHYGVQIDRDHLYLYGHLSGGWLQMDYDVSNDDFYGEWHDVVAIYDGDRFRMYVDGKAATVDPSYTGSNRHGSLETDTRSIFAIGYNPDDRADDDGTTHKDEVFSGSIKDIRMFIQDQAAGTEDDFPDWKTKITALESAEMEGDSDEDKAAKKAAAIKAAFAECLEGATPELRITGTPALYRVVDTRWKDENGDTITTYGDKYKAYTVEVDVKMLESASQYVFPADSKATITGLSDDEQQNVDCKPNADGDMVTITYTFPRERHPKDDLVECLEGLATTLEIPDPAKNEDEAGTRVYTKASWADYKEAYDDAIERKDDAITTATEEACQTAYEALEAAVTALEKAAETCECELAEIEGFEGKTIKLNATSITETLPNEFSYYDDDESDEGCMKHDATNQPDIDIEYTISGDNTAQAEISGNILTLNHAGSVDVSLTVTLKDGDRTVDTKTAGPVTFTAQSDPADTTHQTQLENKLQEIEDAELEEENYTKGSWKILKDAINEANDYVTKLKNGNPNNEVLVSDVAAVLEKLDITKLEPSTEQSQALVTLMNEIAALNKGDYTVDSWNNMRAVHQQAYDYLEENEGNLSQKRCKEFVDQLTDLKEALELKTAKPAAEQAIKDAIDAAKDIYSGPQNYSDAAWTKFTDAYKAASGNLDGKTTKELEKLAKDLDDATKALSSNIDQSKLDDSVTESLSKALTSNSKYTATSWSDYEKALKALKDAKANGVIGKELIALQMALRQAEGKLVEDTAWSAAKTALTGAISAARGTYTAGNRTNKYTAATWSAFATAYSNATAKANATAGDSTAATLTGLADKLKEAQKKLALTPATPPTQEKPKLESGKTSMEKGGIKYTVIDAAKKTVRASGVASQKKKLKKVNIPATVTINGETCKVTEVAAKGFQKFTKITTVTLGKNVTKIGDNSFNGCSAIKSVTVNATAKVTFGKQSFNGCKKLGTLTLKSKKVPKFGKKVFAKTNSKGIKVKYAKGTKAKDKKKIKSGVKKAGAKKVK